MLMQYFISRFDSLSWKENFIADYDELMLIEFFDVMSYNCSSEKYMK